MVNVTNVTIGNTGLSPPLVVDSTNVFAYASNSNNPMTVYKITDIDTPTQMLSATLSTFGSGDIYPKSMILVGGSLFVHCSTWPAARLARVNISTFTWNKTV